MELKEAIEILEYHQAWRKGKNANPGNRYYFGRRKEK